MNTEPRQVTFLDCLMAAAGKPEFVENYDRLNGTNLSRKGSPIELAIDDASGRVEAELAGFINFVHDAVWLRLPAEVRSGGE